MLQYNRFQLGHMLNELQQYDALDRLKKLILDATVVQKRRIATKPTRGSQKRRIDGKTQRGDIKRGRGKVDY